MKTVIEVDNLTKYYGKTLGVKNISFKVQEGEIFGLIGSNGAGKSTTIRSIMDLINKDSGSIKIFGKEQTRNNIENKSLIGYLPSEVHLYEDMTVKEMLDFHETFYKRKIHPRRCELVRRLKLDESKKIEELSFGNLKKLGIILSLMHHPKILILDEATSGLDPIMQQEFYNILLEEKKKGTTILYSTHILSEVSKICDRVLIMKDGRLLTIEDINEIHRKNLLKVTITSAHIDKIKENLEIKPILENNLTIEFQYHPEKIDHLIKVLSDYEIDNILIEEGRLEDLFLHYYK